ncbi:hypothetical protein [Pseudomonas veronii]|uniref:hypothetical protein n=1 Tax=Pseudomonas veronii TaxID=76761 RepID=UPI0006974E7A|nr:hypothetical protein [Pseudomonas veronii]
MVGGFHYEALFVGEVCYLMPSLGFSVLLALLSRRWGFCEILKFPGVLVHEMLHFTVGFVTMAHPISISSIPRLVNGRLVRGSVGFVGLNWLNAWLTALAPLLALPIMFVLARWRLSGGAQHFVLMDVCIWVLFGIRPAKSSTQPCKAKTWCALKFKWAPFLAF